MSNMQLVPGTQDKYRLVVRGLVAMVVILSVTGAFLLGRHAAAQVRTELRDRSQTIAAALNSDEVSQLSGRLKDQDLPVYKQLKARLAGIKTSNPAARSLYLTGDRS